MSAACTVELTDRPVTPGLCTTRQFAWTFLCIWGDMQGWVFITKSSRSFCPKKSGPMRRILDHRFIPNHERTQ
jgi:hypothetical protein